ncbi:hypothetical protein [Serinibacter salmoneus]|uniref:DoxX-like protein n=1 Tax=Serinibacter salmoneus TaxID=556530 RepID=A0A2A9D5F8_9MICO|nr:hypothetical protein [Serinibacter salmoneus]PFG21192.1 hypothetical protein ATL40_2815 [Serinibacter salmoneus]
MSTNAPSTPLEDRPVPVRLRLAAAWASLMFLYLYVDYYHLYKPGTVEDIGRGVVFEFAISPALLTGFLALVAVPAMMIAASVALPARAARTTTLVVAALYVPVTVFNAVGESWAWAGFYGLSIGLELLLLGYALRAAWTWPRARVESTEGPTAQVTPREPVALP